MQAKRADENFYLPWPLAIALKKYGFPQDARYYRRIGRPHFDDKGNQIVSASNLVAQPAACDLLAVLLADGREREATEALAKVFIETRGAKAKKETK
jgi:hypothetical protein